MWHKISLLFLFDVTWTIHLTIKEIFFYKILSSTGIASSFLFRYAQLSKELIKTNNALILGHYFYQNFKKISRLILLSFLKTYSASSIPPQSSKSKFSLSSTIKPQSITVHYFSFIATATRNASDNQIAIHSREIIHIRFEGLYIGK